MSWPTTDRGSKKKVCRHLSSETINNALLRNFCPVAPGLPSWQRLHERRRLLSGSLPRREIHTTAANCSKQRDGTDTTTALMSSSWFRQLTIASHVVGALGADLLANKAGSGNPRPRPLLRRRSPVTHQARCNVGWLVGALAQRNTSLCRPRRRFVFPRVPTQRHLSTPQAG